jgi:hypothetical protein
MKPRRAAITESKLEEAEVVWKGGGSFGKAKLVAERSWSQNESRRTPTDDSELAKYLV